MNRIAEAEQHYQQGRLDDAQRLCETLLEMPAEVPTRAWYLLGLIAHRRGESDVAAERMAEAIRLAPENPEYLTHGSELFRRAGWLERAIAAASKATEVWPGHPAPHNNLGLALKDDGQLAEAESSFRRAISLDPTYARAHLNLGNTLQAQDRSLEARACLEEALRLRPNYPEALNSAGQLSKELGNPQVAVRLLQRAIDLRPGYTKALLNMANALAELRQVDQAESILKRLTASNPEYVEAFHDLGALYEKTKRVPDAIAAYQRVRQLQPDSLHSLAALENAKRNVCDWSQWPGSVEQLLADTRECLAAGQPSPLLPLVSCRFPTTSRDRHDIAVHHARRVAARVGSVTLADAGSCRADYSSSKKLKVGFLSHEFRYHVVSHLMLGLYRRFDRSQFEVFAFDYSPDDQSAMRQQVIRDVDQFIDVSEGTDRARAERIAEQGVHILLDINSYMPGGRPGIAAHRPAPLQIVHMYPATTGADHIDYFITDPVVSPAGDEQFFTEQLIYLPPCYLPTDSDQPIDEEGPTRRDCKLPEDAFVFCSFNKCDKIEPLVFDIWMRVLNAVPSSVFWLRSDGPAAAANLRSEATRRGVDADRLIFAGEVPGIPQHLARQQHADLFLDTLTHGAHGTAVDALWAGLPLLTWLGPTFTSRVAASLLTSAGMEELIAHDLRHYETLAVELGSAPDRVHKLSDRLIEKRHSGELLSTDRYVRNLENALLAVWERFMAGDAPAPIRL